MDISQLELIDNAFEGLLGIALHPRVNENSLFYLTIPYKAKEDCTCGA